MKKIFGRAPWRDISPFQVLRKLAPKGQKLVKEMREAGRSWRAIEREAERQGLLVDSEHVAMLPEAVAAEVNLIEDDRERQAVAWHLHGVFKHGERQTHSMVTRAIVGGGKRYPRFIARMKGFSFIERDESYVPKRPGAGWVDRGKEPRCKAFKLKEGHANHNTLCGGDTPVPLGRDFMGLVGRAFDRFYRLVLRLRPSDAASAVADALASVSVAGISSASVAASCCGLEQVAATTQRLCNFAHGHYLETKLDAGGRVYHRLTNLKKQLRRKLRMGGESVAEVDLHATFVCAIAALFARGQERQQLVAMLQGGRFYQEFAGLSGFSSSDVKANFMREVVFSRKRPGNSLWDTFQSLFPGTARRLSAVRDTDQTVAKVKRKKDVNGRPFTQTTTAGQVRLSRLLTRVESAIFSHGALLQLHRSGIAALPFHDCLMVAQSNCESAIQSIMEHATRVLGFEPKLSVTPGS